MIEMIVCCSSLAVSFLAREETVDRGVGGNQSENLGPNGLAPVHELVNRLVYSYCSYVYSCNVYIYRGSRFIILLRL